MSLNLDAVQDAMEDLAKSSLGAGITEAKQIVSGDVAERFWDIAGQPTLEEQLHMSWEEQAAIRREKSKQIAARYGESNYSRNLSKHEQQVQQSLETGKIPGRGERVVGMVCGDEPPHERARMWVDLLLEPSGRAVLGQQAAWMTQTLIGYDALMKGSNADALEGMCCFLGLAGMAFNGDVDELVQVVAALGERADRTAASLCQWLAHLPVGQDFMYGGNWKAPEKSNEQLKMSPLLTTPSFVKVLDALVRLLRLMADPQTEALHGQGSRFISACLRSRHLPAAMRRLVQVIGRHDQEGFEPIAPIAIKILVNLCELSPLFVQGLREHPRVAALLHAVARVGPEEAGATLLQREHVHLCRLRSLCVHVIADKEQAPPKAMRGKEVTECDRCGAWCEKQQRCGGCKAVSYCDLVCQKAAWKQHKKMCRASQAAKSK